VRRRKYHFCFSLPPHTLSEDVFPFPFFPSAGLVSSLRWGTGRQGPPSFSSAGPGQKTPFLPPLGEAGCRFGSVRKFFFFLPSFLFLFFQGISHHAPHCGDKRMFFFLWPRSVAFSNDHKLFLSLFQVPWSRPTAFGRRETPASL